MIQNDGLFQKRIYKMWKNVVFKFLSFGGPFMDTTFEQDCKWTQSG
jgi:hypothetical protein